MKYNEFSIFWKLKHDLVKFGYLRGWSLLFKISKNRNNSFIFVEFYRWHFTPKVCSMPYRRFVEFTVTYLKKKKKKEMVTSTKDFLNNNYKVLLKVLGLYRYHNKRINQLNVFYNCLLLYIYLISIFLLSIIYIVIHMNDISKVIRATFTTSTTSMTIGMCAFLIKNKCLINHLLHQLKCIVAKRKVKQTNYSNKCAF